MNGDQFRSTLREKWTALLETWSNYENMMPQQFRTFRCDMDGDGHQEYCIQIGSQFLALSDGAVVLQGQDRFVMPIRTDAGVSTDFIDLGCDTLRRIRNGRVQWERSISRRRWGFGLGRDQYDELHWKSDWVGVHEVQSKPIALSLINREGNDQPHVVIFTQTGCVMIFDLNGRIIASVQKAPGYYDKAQFFQFAPSEKHPAGMWAVTAYCRQRRSLGIFNSSEHEWATIMMQEARAISCQRKIGLVCLIPGETVRFLSPEGNTIVMESDTRALRECARPDRDSRRFPSGGIAFDHVQHDRVQILVLEEKSRMIRAVDADEIVQWEKCIGSVGCQSVKLVGAALGVMGSAAEGKLAIVFSEDIKLPDYQTTYTEYRVRVMGVDGTTVAEYELPRGDGWSDTSVIFDDIDGDGKAEILLISRERGVFVLELELPESENSELLLPSQKAMAALPDFPMPPEDIWNQDLLDTAPPSRSVRNQDLSASDSAPCDVSRQPVGADTETEGD